MSVTCPHCKLRSLWTPCRVAVLVLCPKCWHIFRVRPT